MKAKLNTGLATPARKSESVARVESLSRKNNWRANHPLRGRQRVASFSCSKSEYRPCFRGVKGESRVFTRERQPQSSSGVRDRPVLGDKRVGVVALRYNGRPKTVGVWLITWWTFWCSFIPPVLIFLFLISTGGNEIERPKSREQIYSPDFEMACRFGTGSDLPPHRPDNRRKAFQFQVRG